MPLTRTLRRRIVAIVAMAVLFAQFAVSAYACPLALTSGAMASNVADSAAAPAAAMPGCDGTMAGALDPAAPNLCAEHCKQGQQSDQAATLSVPAAVMTALYATQPVPVTSASPRPAAATLSALVAASPPHAIAHCVYRI